jgi:hypothetical protein
MLLQQGHTRPETVSAKSLQKSRKPRQIGFFLATSPHYNTAVEVIAVPTDGHRASSHVQKVLAGEFRLVGNEGNRASALVPIRRSTESAVPARSSAKSTTRSMKRLAGSIVVPSAVPALGGPSVKHNSAALTSMLQSICCRHSTWPRVFKISVHCGALDCTN